MHASFQLRDLQIELRKAPLSYQQQVSTRVAHYKADLSSLRRQVNSGSSMREQLFSKEREDDDVCESVLLTAIPTDKPFSSQHDFDGGERAMLLKNTDALRRASGSLARAHQVSADTDQLAVGVMEDLSDQKATLVRTRNRVS